MSNYILSIFVKDEDSSKYRMANELLPQTFDQPIQNQQLAKGRTLYDPCYLKTFVETNKKQSDHHITNFREHYKNCKKDFDTSQEVYYHIGINDGGIGACNIDADSKVTRGNFWSRPVDKLNEQVTSERHMLYLPNKDKNVNDNDFLTSTTHSFRPQTQFDPSFEIYGKFTRDYVRRTDDYYRKCKNFDDCNMLSDYGRRYK